MNSIFPEQLNAEQSLPPKEVIENDPEIVNYIRNNLFSTIIQTISRKWMNRDIMWKFTCRQHKVYSTYVMKATAEPTIIRKPLPLAYKNFTLKERIQRAWYCFKQKSSYENL